MSLADGFNSALGTFLTIRDENRKSKLHDLKVEAYNQQNFGRFLDNHYKSESMDDRLGYDEAIHRKADSQAALEASRLRVQEELEPHLVRSGIAEADYQQNRASYYGGMSRKAHADATVAERTVDFRVDKSFHDARSAGAAADLKVEELFETRVGNVQDRLVSGIEAHGTLRRALHDPNINGEAVGLANVMYREYLSEGQEIVRINPLAEGGYLLEDNNGKPITVNRSADPDDPPRVFTDEELIGALVGDEAGEMIQRTAQTRQAERQVGADVAATGARLEQERVQRTEAAQDNADRFQRGRTLAGLEAELAEAERVLKEEIWGQGGSARDRQLAKEQQGKIATLRSNIAAMRESGVEVIDEKDYVTAQRRQLGGLGSLDQRRQENVIRGGQRMNDFNTSIQAGVEDPVTNLRQTGDPSVTTADQTSRVTTSDALDRPRRELSSRIRDNAKSYESSLKTQDRTPKTAPARAASQVEGFFAENPDIVRDAANSPETMAYLEALGNDAVLLAMDTGESAAFYMNDAMKYENPEAQAAARMMYQSNIWDSKQSPDDRMARFRAAQEAARLVEDRGMTRSAAYQAALQTVGQTAPAQAPSLSRF